MASKAQESYAYKPLIGSRDIRLVTLRPGTGEQEISLTMAHISLDGHPAYDALSYVWGPQYPSYRVSCDEAFLEIGENLRDALRYLRKPRATRVLWVDRIAINQEDLEERAVQVELMADIYSSASEVPVWLGTADGNTDLAFRCIDDLARKMLAFWKSEALLQRPWFSRVWTFQEIVLARTPVL
ncbi:HET-domain-containing protein, partial [Hyaloscypha variabilis F]